MAVIAKTVGDLWVQACKGIVSSALADKWWHVLKEHYEEQHRHYHTLEHIHAMCKNWTEVKHQLKAPKEVFFATLFHDVIYDPKAADNEERSAELFMDFAKDCFDEKCCIDVGNIYNMILLTKNHQTDAHSDPDSYFCLDFLFSIKNTREFILTIVQHHMCAGFGEEDVHYFLDMDMAILGQTSDEYDKYASKIRLEFLHIEEKRFYQRRAQVLTSFLEIPKIYCTREFHDKYETQAKENLKREISFCNGKC